MRPVLKLQPCNNAIKSFSVLGIPLWDLMNFFKEGFTISSWLWFGAKKITCHLSAISLITILALQSVWCILSLFRFFPPTNFFLFSASSSPSPLLLFSGSEPLFSSLLSSDSSAGSPSFAFLPCPSLLQTNMTLCCSRVKPDSREVLVRIEKPILPAY